MDKEPFIVKSGKGHSIEIEQGSTHAKSRRNVVASEDDDRAERMVGEGVQEERRSSEESGHVGLTNAVAEAQASAIEAPQEAAARQSVETAAAEAREVLADVPEPEAPADAGKGPVLQLEVQGDEDARAEKAGVDGDRFVGEDEQPAPDDEFVAEPEAQPLTNRQKIENLQASANRILVEQAEFRPGDLDIAKHASSEPELVLPEVDEPPAPPEVPDEPVAAVAPPPAPIEELPPELVGNIGFTPAATPETPESAFLARVKALRNNMSVTDDRLTKLQSKPPVKP